MRVFSAMAAVIIAGCGFSGSGGDAPVDDIDATVDDPADAAIDAPPGTLEVAHLNAPVEVTLVGTTDWMITQPTTIDTSALTSTTAMPAGVVLFAAPQEGGGPELAVLDVHHLDVSATLTVVGARPLIVAASGHINVTSSGVIDGAADRQRPGAGGDSPGAGAGAGGAGTASSSSDSGGGGAGYGGGGAPGGASATGGGAAGATFGDETIARLVAGSGGGAASPSCRQGGAGGGAIQLTARDHIHVEGHITVGGGGAQEGGSCSGQYSSGAGGGSGGSIYLQSDDVSGAGWLAANGGGGSSGSYYVGPVEGNPGQNAGTEGAAAAGGPSPTANGGAGGSGGTGLAAPTAGAATSNGGGGGGGVGRIYLQMPPAANPGALQSSPSFGRGS